MADGAGGSDQGAEAVEQGADAASFPRAASLESSAPEGAPAPPDSAPQAEELPAAGDASGAGSSALTGEGSEAVAIEENAAAAPPGAPGAPELPETLKELDRKRKRALKELQAAEKAELQNKQALGATERLAYLMKQTDIFAHFVNLPVEKEGKSDSTEKGKGRKGKGRLSEKQEDELLVKEADSSEGARLTEQPKCVSVKAGKMRPYQLEGLNWMIKLHDHGINGILADEMGLGKTLQTISLLGYLKEVRGVPGPHIVIAPKSTISNWYNEVNRWCPSLRAFKFHGDKETRNKLKQEYLETGKNFDICIASYETISSEQTALTKLTWQYLIIDEAHRIKNEKAVLSQVVRKFSTHFRLLITGTPLQNDLHELWAMLNFLLPDIFSDASTFDNWFNLSGDANQGDILNQLHKILRPFLLRRLKSEVEKSLPPKKEIKLMIGMSEMQQKWYSNILTKNIDVVNASGNRTQMLNILMQLRKCANHPYLFEGAEEPPFINDHRLVENAGKMVLLDKLLLKLKAGGNRVLIFSQMTRMLDILEDYCVYRDWEYCRIDGGTSGEDRDAAMENFNKPGSTKFIFMLSTRAGGLGINLATADTVILYDSDWNPQMDLQAMDRAHRIGQTKPVIVYRFMTSDSVEEKIIDRAQKKLFLDAVVIQQAMPAGLTEKSKTLSKEEMLSMIRFGADAIFHSKGQYTDEDIDAIIARGKERTERDNAQLQIYANNTLANFSITGEEKSLYEYDGQDYKGLDAAGANNTPFALSLPKRNHGNKTYDENEYYRNKLTGKEREKGPNIPKVWQPHDFQFFDMAKLQTLHAKEMRHHHYKLSRRAETDDDNEVAPPGLEPLTEKEEAEKAQLMSEGFSSWSKKDFNAFVRGCEMFGRHDLTSVAEEVVGKDLKEVAKYASVFFKRFRELKDHDKIMRRIQQGEEKIQRRDEIARCLNKKVSKTKNPWVQLRINYGGGAARGKHFTEENDRFLVCMTNQLGYGRWDELRSEIRQSWVFRFDWFFKTRTSSELSRRVDFLVRTIEKEIQEEEAEEAKNKKGKGPSAGSKRSMDESTPPASKKRK